MLVNERGAQRAPGGRSEEGALYNYSMTELGISGAA